MVAKRQYGALFRPCGLNLAKIHMVAKRMTVKTSPFFCLNLAKIHMVAKQQLKLRKSNLSLNLAKIHMVAKPTRRAENQ